MVVNKYATLRIAVNHRRFQLCFIMKYIIKKPLVIVSALFVMSLFQSCLLTEEDSFVCEKNAPIKVNNADKCAFAVGDNYNQDTTIPSERIVIKFSYSGGNFQIYLNALEIKPGETYWYPGEASLSFPELNKGGSGRLLITAFDRTARTISGEFNMTAEGAANYTAYDYEVSGTFNEVSF